MTTVERSAAAVWRDGVMEALVAFDPSQPRDETGKWTSDGSDQSAASNDEEAKRLYAALLNLPPGERDKFLAGLNGDQLTRLGKFASLGKASDGPIADIRNKTGQAMQKRGLNPATAGLKSTGGKKKGAAKKKGGGGSKGGGGKSSGGGGSKGGGSKKSSGGGSKSKSSGGGSSSSKKPATKKPATKAPAKAAPKPPAKKPTPPPALSPVPGRPRPGVPAPPGGPPRALRSSSGAGPLTAAYNPSQPRLPHGGFGGGRWAGKGGSPGGSKPGGGGGGGKPLAAKHADEITGAADRKKAARELSRDELGAVDQEMSRRASALGKDGQVSKAHQAVKDEIARRDKAPTKPAPTAPAPSPAPSSPAPSTPKPAAKPAAPSGRSSSKPAPSTGKAHDTARDSVDDGDQDRLAGALDDLGVADPDDAADRIMAMGGGKRARKDEVDRLVAQAKRAVRASALAGPKTLAEWNAARYAAAKASR